ncbi:MAG: hypothetical protein GEU79_12110, partial [Acidimicrobiia bacterium]|nr:hypothetical protein [Acidimicrobiia bacterium]
QAHQGQSGVDQFQYEACDVDGDCVWETIRVTVVPNRPPTAVDDWVEGPPGAVRTVDVVANDTDPDNDPLELVEITMPPDPYAQASIVNGQIRVDLSNRTNPPQHRNTEIIGYRVCDPDGLCTQGKLIVRLVRRWDTGSASPTITPGGWWGADPLNNGRNFTTSDPISGSGGNEEVYQSEQYGPSPDDDNQRPRSYGYEFQVSPGRWGVRLHFAEIWWNANGQRVFDILIEGEQKLEDLDIHALVGHDAAHREAFDVSVADGNIIIRFDASIDNASIVGIELIPMHETLFEVATRQGTKPR